MLALRAVIYVRKPKRSDKELFVKTSPASAFICAMLVLHAAHAAPQARQEMADKIAQNFSAEKKMAGPSTAKCNALSRVISDLTDLATACTQLEASSVP
jgi:hypothetical protein